MLDLCGAVSQLFLLFVALRVPLQHMLSLLEVRHAVAQPDVHQLKDIEKRDLLCSQVRAVGSLLSRPFASRYCLAVMPRAMRFSISISLL